MSDDAFTRPELAIISAWQKAAKTAPEFMAVEAFQELARLYVKIEPLLPDSDKATLFGIGAYLCNVGRAEMKAGIEAAMMMGKLRAERS